MNKKTVAIFVACMLLVCFASVYITIAYLTSETSEITNTFTYGNVAITLTETEMDEYGIDAAVPANRISSGSNLYKLIPNKTFTKDPTITLAASSESAYIGAVIEVSNAQVFAGDAGLKVDDTAVTIDNYFELFGMDIDDSLWTITSSEATVDEVTTWTYKLVYKTAVAPGESEGVATATDVVIFNEFVTPDMTDTELETLANVGIDVKAYAVQTHGFDTPAEALTAAFSDAF